MEVHFTASAATTFSFVAKVADQAHSRIFELRREEKKAATEQAEQANAL